MTTIILKATEACNARCAYCDVVHKQAPAVTRMSPELLETVFVRGNEFLLQRPQEELEIVWHGGEPLLMGPEFYELAAELQKKHCPLTQQRIRHAVQTNLTLLSSRFIPAFAALGIRSVGSSYDPIPEVRGLGRDRDWREYDRRFMDGIRLLEESGLSWGVIYVVTRLTLEKPLDVFHFMTNLNPTGNVSFNPVLLYDQKAEHLRISPDEFVDFLGALLPVWWRHRLRYPNVEPFASLAKNLVDGGSCLSCVDAGRCADSHLNIAPDGSVSQCGRACDWHLLDYGSIVDKSIAQIMADPQRDELRRRSEVLAEGECKGCRFWDICHGGCPLDGWVAGGSFMHKTGWCAAKRKFIEKYFEPTVRPTVGHTVEPKAVSSPAPSSPPLVLRGRDRVGAGATQSPPPLPSPGVPGEGEMRDRLGTPTNGDLPWINPFGGLGDALMISGVLKQVIDADPTHRFNLVARTKYRHFLEGHPAIARIGHPPLGASFLRTDYWDEKDYDQRRSYQVLARMFGLALPVEERLFVPWPLLDDPQLAGVIPWQRHNVLISAASDSPRKQMSAEKWESLVATLRRQGCNVVQAGLRHDRYIRGSYSILGLTTPRQIISLLRRFDAVITCDNFLMHAAHLCNVPAVVVWGPTKCAIYGYAGQVHFQTTPRCAWPDGCIGPNMGRQYGSPCPEGAGHCMNQIDVDLLAGRVLEMLDGG